MNNGKIEIRKALKADIPSIFGLVEDLADYENALSEVKVDIDYYEQEFDQKTFEAIVAEAIILLLVHVYII